MKALVSITGILGNRIFMWLPDEPKFGTREQMMTAIIRKKEVSDQPATIAISGGPEMNKEQIKVLGASATEGSMHGSCLAGDESEGKKAQASDDEVARTQKVMAWARASYHNLMMEGFRERMKAMFAEDAKKPEEAEPGKE